jgi:hypothetical protein
MTTLDDYPILRTVREADHPDLNWLVKPGECVQYFRRTEVPIRTEWHKQWVPISAGEAYEIARRRGE